MRVLITGGNGFIGSHLQDRLLAEGHEVRVLDRGPERFRPGRTEVDFRCGELGNEGLVAEALAGIEAVFHLAWTTVPKSSNDDPSYDVLSNVVESVRLFAQACHSGVRRVVFLSTGGTVYGPTETQPVPESHPTNPICSYGITKLTVEKYLGLFHGIDGLGTTILRCSNAYGERQDPRAGQGAVGVFLWRTARGLPIEVWGDGSAVRDYVHVSDIADAFVRALARPAGAADIVNIGSGVGTSLSDLIGVIRHVTGRDVEASFGPARALDVPANILDIRLARERLGWEPRVGLAEGIARVWDWVLAGASSA